MEMWQSIFTLISRTCLATGSQHRCSPLQLHFDLLNNSKLHKNAHNFHPSSILRHQMCTIIMAHVLMFFFTCLYNWIITVQNLTYQISWVRHIGIFHGRQTSPWHRGWQGCSWRPWCRCCGFEGRSPPPWDPRTAPAEISRSPHI